MNAVKTIEHTHYINGLTPSLPQPHPISTHTCPGSTTVTRQQLQPARDLPNHYTPRASGKRVCSCVCALRAHILILNLLRWWHQTLSCSVHTVHSACISFNFELFIDLVGGCLILKSLFRANTTLQGVAQVGVFCFGFYGDIKICSAKSNFRLI